MSYSSYNKRSYENIGPQSVGSYGRLLEHFVSNTQRLTGNPNPRVLDCGAGSGIYAQYLSDLGCDVTALDPNIDSMQMTSTNRLYQPFLTYRDDGYDLVHAKDLPLSIEDFLTHAATLLNHPGLIACVFVPLRNSLMTAYTTRQRLGLEKISSIGSWEPGDGEQDWYLSGERERSVIFARN